MGHVLSNMTIKGETGERALTDILVDSGATYTVLSSLVMEQVGAVKASLTTDVELGDGRKVKAAIYYASAGIDGREGPAIILSFEGAREVIGVQTLEALGLRLDPATGKLEATRPKSLAYFYSMS
jgi:predicted aspartyl protease